VARDVDNYLGERLSFLERLAATLPPELLASPERCTHGCGSAAR
jgi:hypothetical protein